MEKRKDGAGARRGRTVTVQASLEYRTLLHTPETGSFINLHCHLRVYERLMGDLSVCERENMCVTVSAGIQEYAFMCVCV